MKTKVCIYCKKQLPNTIKYFHKRSAWYTLNSHCIECHKIKCQKRNYEKKLKIMRIYGSNKCICGYNKSIIALSFHHLNPNEKEHNFNKIPMNKIKSEIKKCIMVCRNCHMEIHEGLYPKIMTVKHSKHIGSMQCRKFLRLKKAECVNYLGKNCKHCGYNKCDRALDFHHINDSNKLFEISQKLHYPFEKLKIELDKCILLCSNCHAEEHARLCQKL